MNKMKIGALLALSGVLIGCGTGKKSETSSKESEVLTMWLAPNIQQEGFWTEAIKEWNESGLGMRVEAKGIPAANSSEEAILTAMASETTPDIVENINPSFAYQLAEMDQLVDLKKLDGYETLIANRKMENIMTGWEVEGENYVFPLYVNPVLYWWRMDLLKEIGVEVVPTTYEEIYEISEKFAVKNQKYTMTAYKGANWWDRWFDFITMYYGNSGATSYIKDNKANMDNKSGEEVMEFFQTMFKNEWAPIQLTHEEFFTGQVLGDAKGPWDIPYAKNTFPEVFKNVKVGPVPVLAKNKVELQPTFADTKGLVIFNNSKKKDEAWKFISWIMEQDKFSKLWLEKTGMSPARGDLLELEELKKFYEENPEVAMYSKYVPVAKAAALITKQTEIQQIMTNSLLEPVIYKKETIKEALENTTKKINKELSE